MNQCFQRNFLVSGNLLLTPLSSDSAPLAYVTSTADTKHQGHPVLMAEALLSPQRLSIYN